jgi:hypothetical protein
MSQNQAIKDGVKKGFEKALNRHGYGFQYSVLEVAGSLSEKGRIRWVFEAAEFPVEVQGYGTRIDFVLRLSGEPLVYLLAECKRANPALSNWCFAKAPLVTRNRTTCEPLFLEYAWEDEEGHLHASAKQRLNFRDKAYHIALEVKSQETGDPGGGGRGAIEEAATQVCRGLNGMVEFLAKNTAILPKESGAYFLPVVFTTAQLWASEIALSSAELESGKVDLEEAEFGNKPWVLYQYHTSPGLKHSHSPNARPARIGAFLESEYIRTIAIVGASSIGQFLQWSSNADLYLP